MTMPRYIDAENAISVLEILADKCADDKAFEQTISVLKDVPTEDVVPKEKMNKVWVVIRFGRWCHKATSMYLYDRVYKNGYKWTPFCLKSFRYIGG